MTVPLQCNARTGLVVGVGGGLVEKQNKTQKQKKWRFVDRLTQTDRVHCRAQRGDFLRGVSPLNTEFTCTS